MKKYLKVVFVTVSPIIISILFYIFFYSCPAHACLRLDVGSLTLDRGNISDKIGINDVKIAALNSLIDAADFTILLYERWTTKYYSALAYWKEMGNKEEIKKIEDKICYVENKIIQIKKTYLK
jgi:hypothetical protein